MSQQPIDNVRQLTPQDATIHTCKWTCRLSTDV